jgi:hypothetical protein
MVSSVHAGKRAVIERYAPWVDHSLTAIMRVADTGEWVRYAEVVALEARVAVLESQVELIKEEVNGE